MDEVKHFADLGVSFAAPAGRAAKLLAHKNKVVGKLTGGLAAMAKMRKVTVVRGYGSFIDPHHVQVEETTGTAQDKTGKAQTIRFKQCIIAAGSQAVRLPFLPDDPRIVDSTGALELRASPKRMLIIGGGIIGLEMGTVYSTLGARLDVVEMLDGLMQGADRDLVKVWQKMNAPRFDHVMLKTKTVGAEATATASWCASKARARRSRSCLRPGAAGGGPQPNGKKIGADKAGVAVTDRGFIPVDSRCAPTCRTSSPSATSSASRCWRTRRCTRRMWRPRWRPATARQCSMRASSQRGLHRPRGRLGGPDRRRGQGQGHQVKKGLFPWTASGRAIANGRDEGFTKLLFDAETHRILGGGIVGTHAGDMIGEVALAIEMGADEVDIGKTIHPHPTLGESIGMAAEVAHGSCTDLPPARK
jgi:dihydrolipoamide dehydrogenase